MQAEGSLVPYTTSKGHYIVLLRNGILSVSQMFDAEHYDVRFETWKLRAAGMFIMYASSVCLVRLLKILCNKPSNSNSETKPLISYFCRWRPAGATIGFQTRNIFIFKFRNRNFSFSVDHFDRLVLLQTNVRSRSYTSCFISVFLLHYGYL